MLQSMGSQRVGHDLATEQQMEAISAYVKMLIAFSFIFPLLWPSFCLCFFFFFLVNSNTYIIKDISKNKRTVAEHAGLYNQPLSQCWQGGRPRITTPTF